MPARIVVDERERKSGIPDMLRQAGAIIDFAHLKVGDYVISPETAVERKTINDLLNSIYDGRLFVQCSELNEHYLKPALIVEGSIVDWIQSEADKGFGNPDELKVEGLDLETIKGQRKRSKTLIKNTPLIFDALVKIALDFRIPVIHTPSADFTSQLLVVMVHKTIRDGRATGPLLKRIKKGYTLYIQQISILSSLPGVGNKLAVRMLERFQTPGRALNASAAELARISGFGTERAAKVRRILDNTASQHNNSSNQIVKDSRGIERRTEVVQRTLLEEISESNNRNNSDDRDDYASIQARD